MAADDKFRSRARERGRPSTSEAPPQCDDDRMCSRRRHRAGGRRRRLLDHVEDGQSGGIKWQSAEIDSSDSIRFYRQSRALEARGTAAPGKSHIGMRLGDGGIGIAPVRRGVRLRLARQFGTLRTQQRCGHGRRHVNPGIAHRPGGSARHRQTARDGLGILEGTSRDHRLEALGNPRPRTTRRPVAGASRCRAGGGPRPSRCEADGHDGIRRHQAR